MTTLRPHPCGSLPRFENSRNVEMSVSPVFSGSLDSRSPGPNEPASRSCGVLERGRIGQRSAGSGKRFCNFCEHPFRRSDSAVNAVAGLHPLNETIKDELEAWTCPFPLGFVGL
jgi:hypothetical protein